MTNVLDNRVAISAETSAGLLDVPSKHWTKMAAAGHRPHFEQPAVFAGIMRDVRSDTR